MNLTFQPRPPKVTGTLHIDGYYDRVAEGCTRRRSKHHVGMQARCTGCGAHWMGSGGFVMRQFVRHTCD